MKLATITSCLAGAALASAADLNAVPSTWDGHCFYPKPDIGFQLDSYLGKWYQVAGTVAPFTAGCKCIQAQYALNVRMAALNPQTTSKERRLTFVVGKRHRPSQQHLPGRGPAY